MAMTIWPTLVHFRKSSRSSGSSFRLVDNGVLCLPAFHRTRLILGFNAEFGVDA